MTRACSSLAAPLVVLALLSPPDMGKADCGHIADHYTMSLRRVVAALRDFAKCLATSRQRDDCAAEMQALDDAHDNFADAVADAKQCQ